MIIIKNMNQNAEQQTSQRLISISKVFRPPITPDTDNHVVRSSMASPDRYPVAAGIALR